MADMLTPLAWDAPSTASAAPPAGADKIGREEFLWPAPPLPSYPAPAPQTDPLPCEIAGLNDKLIAGRLTFFVPEEAVAHVQVPPARTTLPLRFDQFPIADADDAARSAADAAGRPALVAARPPRECTLPRDADRRRRADRRDGRPRRKRTRPLPLSPSWMARTATAACAASSCRAPPTPRSRSVRASANCWSNTRSRRRSRSPRRSTRRRNCATRSSATSC